MSNDPTTTPDGEADMSQTGLKTGRNRSTSARSGAGYPGMMGDGTEEQNLGQVGNPSARISEDEVKQAFGARADEPRSFLDKDAAIDAAMDAANSAKNAATDKLSALTDKVNAVRDQVQQSARDAREWATRQATSATDAAKQLHTDKPVLVLSVSAGAALAVGLLAGFVIGRATADEY